MSRRMSQTQMAERVGSSLASFRKKGSEDRLDSLRFILHALPVTLQQRR